MTKIHYECPKYPKTLENEQNSPKTTTTAVKTLKMKKIPLEPQK